MPCEAWKWLAISTGALALIGHGVYLLAVGGWPTERNLGRHAALRPYFLASIGSGVVSVFAVVVYLVHCLD